MHALITGASSGIGAALARAMAEAGYDLTLVARRGALLEELVRAAPKDVRVQARAFDLGETDRLSSLIAEAEQALGPIDVLVNNAGSTLVEHTDLVECEAAERLMRVNLLAPLALSRTVLGGMKARRSGVIVDIASVNAFTPTPYSFHYNAAKAGLAAASESLRAEVRSQGVHVMTVYPGPIRTPLLEEASARVPVATPAFALGSPQTLAKLILRGIERRHARIVYPKLFSLTRMMPNAARWSVERFFPPLNASRQLARAR